MNRHSLRTLFILIMPALSACTVVDASRAWMPEANRATSRSPAAETAQLASAADLVNAAVAYDRAVQAFAVGDFDEAGRRVADSLRLKPGYAPAELLHGRVLIEVNKPLEALDALASIDPSTDPKLRAQAAYYRGVAHEAREALAPAESCYREAMTLDPRENEYALATAEALIDRGDLEAARKVLASRDVVASAKLSASLAFVEMQLGRYSEAIAHFRRAQALDPQPGRSAALGRMLIQTGDFEQAVQVLASAPDRESAAVTLALANALIELGRERQAMEALQELSNGAGATPRVLARLGELYLHLGDDGQASRVADRLMAECPEVSEGYLIKAVVMARRGADEMAKEMAVKGKSRDPVLPKST